MKTTLRRDISITGRRMRREDFQEIARVLEKEYGEAQRRYDERQVDLKEAVGKDVLGNVLLTLAGPRLEFSVKTDDGATVESNDSTVFDAGGVFDNRHVVEVGLTFFRGLGEAQVWGYVRNESSSAIHITGEDGLWVEGLNGVLSSIVKRAPSSAKVEIVSALLTRSKIESGPPAAREKRPWGWLEWVGTVILLPIIIGVILLAIERWVL